MLLLVNAQSELPSWINPIQEGIQVSDSHSAQVTAGQWTLLILIDERVMPDSFFSFIKDNTTNISRFQIVGMWQHQWKKKPYSDWT